MSKFIVLENPSVVDRRIIGSEVSVLGEFETAKESEDYIRGEIDDFLSCDDGFKIGTSDNEFGSYYICEIKRAIQPSITVSAKVTLKNIKEEQK